MGFLPKDFKDSLSNSRYWKVKDMPQGESRFRIVQPPIFGWIDWKDEKPYRYRHEKKPTQSFDADRPLRAFVSCYVWDYARKGLYVLEFSQKTIIVALDNLFASEDWGDITGYDLKLMKEGSGQKVKYALNPTPHKPLSDEIKAALKASPVQLEALFAGGDPWNWGTQPASVLDDDEDGLEWMGDSKAIKAPAEVMSPLDELKEHLEIDGIETNRLEEWIKLRAQTKNETIEAIVTACLGKDILPKFKKSFAKFITAANPEVLAV